MRQAIFFQYPILHNIITWLAVSSVFLLFTYPNDEKHRTVFFASYSCWSYFQWSSMGLADQNGDSSPSIFPFANVQPGGRRNGSLQGVSAPWSVVFGHLPREVAITHASFLRVLMDVHRFFQYPWRIHGAGILMLTLIGVFCWWDPWHTINIAAPLGSVMGYPKP